MSSPRTGASRLTRALGTAALVLTVVGGSGALASPDSVPPTALGKTAWQTRPADPPREMPDVPVPAQRFLAEVAGHVGYREPRHGETPYGRWYAAKVGDHSFAGGAWCGMFLDYCADRAGVGREVRGHAWTVAQARSFDEAGRFDRHPRVGSIVFFDWDGSRRIDAIDHVGVVADVLPDGRILTLEGNTDDRVEQRVRGMKTVVGFGHPDWR